MNSFFPYPLRLLAGLVTTAALVHAQPTPPSVITLPASAVDTTNATFNGTANPDGLPLSVWFQWGTTTNYGNVTPAQALGSGSGQTSFSQVMGGLVGGVTYHFRAVASNSFYVVSGANRSFSTPVFTLVFETFGAERGALAWGDYNGDGRLDIGMNGKAFSGLTLRLWENTSTGFVFRFQEEGHDSASFAWGDYDSDGRLDFFANGLRFSTPFAQLWRNTNGGFSRTNLGLPDWAGPTGWGDFNNDGRLDLSVAGTVWRNTSSGFTNTGSVLNFASISASADFDNDGRLDLLLAGRTNTTFVNFADVWRNTGIGFSRMHAGLDGLVFGGAAAADYDNDGRLDFMMTGATGSPPFLSQVWRNTGNGFTNIQAGVTGVAAFGIPATSLAWGDYDNDGRPDILLTGGTNVVGNTITGFVAQVWRNTGSGFRNINANLPGFGSGSVAWGDYDNDGRLDILMMGNALTNTILQVWRNNAVVTNTPPQAPSGLVAMAGPSSVTFSWNAAIDSQTPAPGLSYNLRVGTAPGSGDILSPMSAADGQRLVPQIGNAQLTRSRTLYNLPLDQPLYWSVQAIDSAFAGSAFAAERTLRLGTVLLPPSGGAVPGDTNGDGIVDQAELNSVLSNYFPNSPWLYVTNVAGLGGSNVTFALSNSTVGAFSVEYTTNLTNWFFLGPALPRYFFTDGNAPGVPQRYYRLRWP